MHKAWTRMVQDLHQTNVAKSTDDLVESVGDGGMIILDPLFNDALMSLLIRYAHIPFYFHFSLTFPTSPICPYTPPLWHDCTWSCSCLHIITLTPSDRSCLFDGHMTYDSHVFTSILSISNVPPSVVQPITRSRTTWSGTFYSFTICSHSCLPFIFNLPVFTFCERTSPPKP